MSTLLVVLLEIDFINFGDAYRLRHLTTFVWRHVSTFVWRHVSTSFGDSYRRLFVQHVGRLYTILQHTINNLEEGRMAHLSSNNVQCLFLMRFGATSSVDTSNRIRTAARDGDRAVGVNRTVAVEPCPSPSNQISQYQCSPRKE